MSAIKHVFYGFAVAVGLVAAAAAPASAGLALNNHTGPAR